MSEDLNLDVVLTEVGEFGLFQVINYLLICIPCALSATQVVGWMVSANTLDYRCKVPECDIDANNRDIVFDQSWLHNVIPTLDDSNGKLDNCFRYAPLNNISRTDPSRAQCDANMFNISQKIKCTEFVYKTDERNIQTELNIHCSDSYKLGLVGTVNNIGRFIFLPLIGFLSDKYGRLTISILGMTCGCAIGLIKSFSTSYLMYICLEFFEAVGNTCFTGMFVMALEGVTTRKRVLGSVIVSTSFPLGGILFGVVAMYVHDFRTIIRLLYTPGLLLFLYFWLVPESVRWLLVTGHVEHAIKILQRTARVNGKKLSEMSIEMIKMTYSKDLQLKSKPTEANDNDTNTSIFQSLKSIIKSKALLLRFLNNCYQWINCCFCYYGLSLISTQAPGGDRYISFIFVLAIEIPGILLALPLLNRMRRRILLCGAFTVTALSTVATSWVPAENSTIILMLLMLGKCSITLAFQSLCVFTAEQWPTNVRTTILTLVSMIGRIGVMVSPLVILTAQKSSLPSFMLGGSAIISAILILFCPETFQKKLPDTVKEAKDLKF